MSGGDEISSHWPIHWEASRRDLTRGSEDEDDIDININTSSSMSHKPSTDKKKMSSIDGPSGHPSSAKREPISLAVAADVTQAQIPDNGDASDNNHARGDAVAQHLQSMLSHISSNDHITTSLKSELNCPPNNVSSHDTKCAARGSTRTVGGGDQSSRLDDENNNDVDQSSSSQQPQSSPTASKEFIFKRMLHAIDNYLPKLLSHVHFPSPRHHQQGHRLNSMNSASASSNHDCTLSCVPACAHQQTQISQNSSRRLPTFAAISTTAASIASNIQTHLQNNNSNDVLGNQQPSKQSKPFFPFPFHLGSQSQSPNKRSSRPRFSGPLLYNTTDHEEHEAVITTALHVCHLYHMGEDVKKYSHHESDYDNDASSDSDDDRRRRSSLTDDSEHNENVEDDGGDEVQHFDLRARHALSSLGFEFRLDVCENCIGENGSTQIDNGKDDSNSESRRCPECVTRLYHIPSNTPVTNDNRRIYIADGKMYDAVANLCQAAAQEIMAETCDLVWVTICDGKGGGLRTRYQGGKDPAQSKPRSNSVEEWPRDENGNIVVQEPVRALVGKQQPNDLDANRPHDTFLVATGKGKVRAGIFSRHHLMTTGLEPSTALPLLREARDRGMNCVVIDPNARGDRVGMDTFEISIRGLFEQQSVLKDEEDDDSEKERETSAIIPANVDGSIYVLAHSAAGGQLVRYLLDQQQGAPLLSRIRCITFTDSTHSIQWLKASHPHISSMIQSSNALYVRSANIMRDDDWENASPGDECPRDKFWSHRFGDIKTVWAGTTEHSLSNWTAQKPIWDHFDKIRGQEGGTGDSAVDKGDGSCGSKGERSEIEQRKIRS